MVTTWEVIRIHGYNYILSRDGKFCKGLLIAGSSISFEGLLGILGNYRNDKQK